VQDFTEVTMGYAKKKQHKTRWVSVPLDERLHEEVRAKAARCRMAWPDIIAEAIGLRLATEPGTAT
jgi:hypothetical protein